MKLQCYLVSKGYTLEKLEMMDSAEVLARVAIHQEQENPEFNFDKFIKREMYYENYPEEYKEYKERIVAKTKKQRKGKTTTIAEDVANIKNRNLKGLKWVQPIVDLT